MKKTTLNALIKVINNRGGKRAGAGRKPGDPQLVKIPVGYKLPFWLVQWIRKQDASAAILIEEALKQRHNLIPPMAKRVKNENKIN